MQPKMIQIVYFFYFEKLVYISKKYEEWKIKENNIFLIILGALFWITKK